MGIDKTTNICKILHGNGACVNKAASTPLIKIEHDCNLKECRHLYKTAGIINANTPQSDGILPNISRIIGSILLCFGSFEELPTLIKTIDNDNGHITLV